MPRPSRQLTFFGDESGPEENEPAQSDVAAGSPGTELPDAVVKAASATPASLEGAVVYVIDANSLIHQVFHAIPSMSSPQGEPVGAVFGFARDLFFLREERRPDYLFCAFDMPGKTFRHELYEPYKAHRVEMDVDLVPQFAMIREVVAAMRIPALGLEGYEADDVLATVAQQTETLGGRCFLVSADKDCRQLISDRVSVYNIRKDAVMDRAGLKEEWGIAPEQVVDFQALVGDSVDNVPGVPQIGPKTARELLEKYGTLASILDHAAEVSQPKRRQCLMESREVALLSRRLVELDRHVPVPIDWELGRVGGVNREQLEVLFRRYGFRSLLSKATATPAVAGSATPPTPAAYPPASAGPPMPVVPPPVPAVAKPETPYTIVDTPESLAALVDTLQGQKSIAVDLETRSLQTTSVWPRWAEIVGYALACNDQEAWYVPVLGPPGERSLDPAATLETLRPILEDPSIEKVGHNLKYDMIVLRTAGVALAGVAFDTMVASYLLDSGEGSHKLNDVAQRFLGYGKGEIPIGRGKSVRRMDEVPIAEVAEYAAQDAVLPLRLRPILAARLAESRLDKLFDELEMPLVEVLVELEYNGIRVDRGRLADLSGRFGQRIEALEAEIHALAGRKLNIASPKQLQQVLFDELKLPVVKRTKTGPSTDADVLEELAAVHPLPAKIVEYRQYAKLKGTYVDALPEMIHPRTGRVHASFNQHITATGRLSSSDPNLQNIPVRTEEGREIRSAFVPGEEGWLLLAADYSQIELRFLAHFSEDPCLLDAFAHDEDIHARVASQVYSVPLGEVTSAMRRQAKTVNFGVIYGQSPFGLAKELGIRKEEAAQFINAYFAGYPGIEGFLDRVLAECQRQGYVTTVLGRRRAIRGVRADAGRQRNLAERTAVNTVIQGSAADLIKQAMIAIQRRLQRENFRAKMLLQIHDELVFEVPPDELDRLAALVTEEMVGAQTLRVPLKVDVKVGPNWADAKEIRGEATTEV